MAVFRTVIRSDLQKPLVVQQLSGNMFTADNASNEIAVEVTNGGEPVALSGAVTAYAVRADGVTAMFSGTISGNVASVILPATCYTKAGTLSIVVKVGSNTVGACTCYVYRTTTDEIVDPGHVIPSIDELLEQIDACRTATANANTAATNANAAASNANTKAALANEKATLADQKATLANTAAQNADTKASLADTAATNANTKAGLANDAATLANTKAALADKKATLADTKATLANTAATNANTKAGLADTAAQNADDKATLANDAATLANTKAGLANTAAKTANTAAGKIDNMTVAASGLPEGSAPVATITEVNGHKHIAFQIPKGDKGKDFRINYTFRSIAEMEAYSEEIEIPSYAMIDTGSVEDVDTGKLYCYESDREWHYIGDLSGAQGIKGETGTGIDHVTLNNDYTLTVYYDDGTSDTTTSIRGATGITPNIAVGTVTTLLPDQQAYVTRDPSSTAENPVFNFGIPKGDTGSAENVYGTTVPMSESDSTTVADAIRSKLDKNQGTSNAGKFMKVGADGNLTPENVPDPTNKADKVANATAGNFAGLDATGNLTDSGKSAEDFAGAIYKTATTGSIVSFEDGADDLPIKELKAAIEPVQDLHGYDHPWPAGGGKNLLFSGAVNETRSGITFTAIGDGSSFIVSGTAKGNVALTILTGAKAPNKLQSGVTYTLSGGHWANTGVAYIQLVYAGDTTGNTISIVSSASTATKTMSEDATLTGIYINFVSGNTFTNDLVQPQFEIGTSATSFSPYSNICPIGGHTGMTISHSGADMSNPETLPISWQTEAGTVYGGTLDVTTGVLTVDRAFALLNDASKWIALQSNTTPYVYNTDFSNRKKYSNSFTGLLCSAMPVNSANPYFTARWSGSISNTFGVKATSPELSIDVFKNLSSNGELAISYELAESQTYQLTPTEVSILLGTNNIWADTGDITELIYPVNTDTAMALYEKADKVQNATSGNFAALGPDGNLLDSGKKPSDFLTQHQDISGKVDKNQGAANAGKALGINSEGQVVPVPFSGEDFTGATPSSPGEHGYVPAPQTTDTEKFLCGDGTWADVAGGKLVTFELDEVTGTGGSYGHITYISSVSQNMKPVLIEVSNPDAFLDTITVSCMDGGITLSCDNVNGSSTVTVSCLFKANPDSITSSEFDVLANRIGTLGNLQTSEKSNLVGAVNELSDNVAQVQDGLAIVANGDTHAAISSGQFVYVKNHDTLAEGLYKASATISANGALSTSNLTPDGSGGLNALQTDLNDKYTALNSKIVWRQIYANSTYRNDVGLILSLSEEVSNAKLLLIVAYTSSIASANRIIFTVPVNGGIPASYYSMAYGTAVQTIRVESHNANLTVLSTSLSSGIFINSIHAMG